VLANLEELSATKVAKLRPADLVLLKLAVRGFASACLR